jgi:hypothetical protein
MTLATVGDLIRETYVQLHDERLRARWSEPELLDYLNQGFEEAVALRPEIGATTAVVELAAGTRQSLPAGGLRLLDISRNMVGATPGRVIRQVDRDNLDGGDPDWHMATPAATIWEFTYDAKREPKAFYVNPPAIAETEIELVYSRVPEYVVFATGWEALPIPLDNIYHTAWINYMIYRALNKMTDYAMEEGRAIAHLKQFYFLIGAKHQADRLSAPVEKPEQPRRETGNED